MNATWFALTAGWLSSAVSASAARRPPASKTIAAIDDSERVRGPDMVELLCRWSGRRLIVARGGRAANIGRDTIGDHFFVKISLGIIACTPFTPSTSWVM